MRRLVSITATVAISALTALHGGFLVANAETPPPPSCDADHTGGRSQNEDVQLACKIAELPQEHITSADDGMKLETDLSDEQLQNDFNFSAKQVDGFRAILAGDYEPSTPQISFYAEEEGKRFYISHEALKTGAFAALVTAAETSPEALAAATVAVSSMMGGPIGTALSGGVALLGIGFFIDFAAKITGAMVQGKGVALYVSWGFPPVKPKIE